MDSEKGLKLFNDDSPEIMMPSANIESNKGLQEGALKDAIDGEVVQRLVLPKSSIIDRENFVFDFSNVDTITIFQKEALKSLIKSEGTVSLYLYRPNGMVKIGKGEKYSLERMVPLVKRYIFNDEINVYKNYIAGMPAKKVVSGDITQMRLNLWPINIKISF